MLTIDSLGVTEKFWHSQSEVFKLYWGLGSKALAGLLGFVVVAKTGLFWVDTGVSILATGIPLVIISAQRALSRYPTPFRKTLIRYSVRATLCTVTTLGVAFYLALSYVLINGVVGNRQPLLEANFDVAMLKVNSDFLSPTGLANLVVCMQLVVVAVALVVALVNAFRGLQIEELIYKAPKRGLLTYLVWRKVKAENVYGFAGFELGIIIASAMFSSTVALVVRFATMGPPG